MGILTIKVKTIDASDGAESESREDAGGNNYKEALKLITFILYYAYYNTFEEPLNEHLYQQILDVQSEKTSMSFALTLGEMLKVMNKQSESIEEDSTLTQTPEAIAKRKNNSDVIAELSHMMAQELEGELLEGLNAGVIRKATTRLKAQVHNVIADNIPDGVGNIISVNGKTIGTKSSILTPTYYEEQSELHRLLNREKYMYIILALKTISTNVEGHNNNLLYKLTLQNAYNVTKNSILVKPSSDFYKEFVLEHIKNLRIQAGYGFSDPYTITIQKTAKKEDENVSYLSSILSENLNENDFGVRVDRAGFIVNLNPNGLFAKAGLKVDDKLIAFKRCYTPADLKYLEKNTRLPNKDDDDKGKAYNVIPSAPFRKKKYNSKYTANNNLIIFKTQIDKVKTGDEVEVDVILKGTNVSPYTMSNMKTTFMKIATQKITKVDIYRNNILVEGEFSKEFDITFNKQSSLKYDITITGNSINKLNTNISSGNIFILFGLIEGDKLLKLKIGNENSVKINNTNLESLIQNAKDNDEITLTVQVKSNPKIIDWIKDRKDRIEQYGTTPNEDIAMAVEDIAMAVASIAKRFGAAVRITGAREKKRAGAASPGSAASVSASLGSVSSAGPPSSVPPGSAASVSALLRAKPRSVSPSSGPPSSASSEVASSEVASSDVASSTGPPSSVPPGSVSSVSASSAGQPSSGPRSVSPSSGPPSSASSEVASSDVASSTGSSAGPAEARAVSLGSVSSVSASSAGQPSSGPPGSAAVAKPHGPASSEVASSEVASSEVASSPGSSATRQLSSRKVARLASEVKDWTASRGASPTAPTGAQNVDPLGKLTFTGVEDKGLEVLSNIGVTSEEVANYIKADDKDKPDIAIKIVAAAKERKREQERLIPGNRADEDEALANTGADTDDAVTKLAEEINAVAEEINAAHRALTQAYAMVPGAKKNVKIANTQFKLKLLQEKASKVLNVAVGLAAKDGRDAALETARKAKDTLRIAFDVPSAEEGKQSVQNAILMTDTDQSPWTQKTQRRKLTFSKSQQAGKKTQKKRRIRRKIKN